MHPTIIKVNSHQFIKNLIAIRAQIGTKVKLCLPVKANGYGHGLLEIAISAEPSVPAYRHADHACVAEL